MTSLRGRLVLTLGLGLAAVWVPVAWWGHQAARHEVDELFDAQLAQAAQTLISTVRHELHERSEHGISSDSMRLIYHEYQLQMTFQAWSPQGERLFGSADARLLPDQPAADGYATRRLQGQDWFVLTRRDPASGYVVQVAEPLRQREWLARHIAFNILWPVFLAAPALLLLIWWLVGRGLRPLRAISAEVEARAANRLDLLQLETVPDEVVPLAMALNGLFARLQQAFTAEQRFTADAAHELRTPLAALKVQAQVALRATQTDQRKDALEKVLQGVDRASHVVTQMLTLARLDPDSAQAHHQPLSLAALAQALTEEMRPLAQARQIALRCGGDAGQVRGDAGQLLVLLRNLLDNALRYTPAGGAVEVTVGNGGGPLLQISDSGPGIPPPLRERVLERFYRIPGNAAPGCGLGLSIVRRIAQLHGAQVQLGDSASGGLQVRVKFPHDAPHHTKP